MLCRPCAGDEAPTLSSASAGSTSGSDDGANSSSDEVGVTIDLQLPRRSLLVKFTCNKCGERSERLVNPVAWHKGMVGGALQWGSSGVPACCSSLAWEAGR